MITLLLRIGAMRSYFHREWDFDTLVANLRETPSTNVRHLLVMVYFSLSCTLASLAIGSYLGSTGYIQSFFAILATFVSAVCFCCISLWIQVNPGIRLCLLNLVTFFGGASLAPWLIKSFPIDISIIVTQLLATCVGFGCFAVITKRTSRFRDVHWRSLLLCALLIFASLNLGPMIFAGSAPLYTTMMYVGTMWFMGYVVLYSQEVVFEAERGGVEDYVIRAIRLYTSLPAVGLHIARLWVEMMQEPPP